MERKAIRSSLRDWLNLLVIKVCNDLSTWESKFSSLVCCFNCFFPAPADTFVVCFTIRLVRIFHWQWISREQVAYPNSIFSGSIEGKPIEHRNHNKSHWRLGKCFLLFSSFVQLYKALLQNGREQGYFFWKCTYFHKWLNDGLAPFDNNLNFIVSFLCFWNLCFYPYDFFKILFAVFKTLLGFWTFLESRWSNYKTNKPRGRSSVYKFTFQNPNSYQRRPN